MPRESKQSSNIDASLDALRSLLMKFEFSNKLFPGWTDGPFLIFSRESTNVYLLGIEAEEFTYIVDQLYEGIKERRKISKAAISRLVSDLFLDLAVATLPVDSSPRASVLDESIKSLKQALFARQNKWHLIIPIENLSPSGLPYDFGGIQFLLLDEAKIKELWQEFPNSTAPPNKSKLVESLMGKTIARVEEEAVDREAALSFARNRLRCAIDCVNLYADRVDLATWAYLAGDAESVAEPHLAIEIGENNMIKQILTGSRRRGPARSLPLNQLATLRGFREISALLGKINRNSFEERLVRSFQWAGRAQVDPRLEEAFLLFAIALESLLLGSSRAEEVAYRLRLRCALLIGEPGRRGEIAANLEKLYRLRSKIVHSGNVEVAEGDWALLGAYCRAALLRVVTDLEFKELSSEGEFEAWFEGKLLGA